MPRTPVTPQPLQLAQTVAQYAQEGGLSTAINIASFITLIEDLFPSVSTLLSCLNPVPAAPAKLTAQQVQQTVTNEWRPRRQRYTPASIHRLSVALEHQSDISGPGTPLSDHDVLVTAIAMMDAVRLSPTQDVQDALDAQGS